MDTRKNNVEIKRKTDCVECDQQDSRCGYRFPRQRRDCQHNPNTQILLSASLPIAIIKAIEFSTYKEKEKHKLLYIASEIFSELVNRKKMDITKPLRLPSYRVKKFVGHPRSYELFSQVLIRELEIFKAIENDDGTRYRVSTQEKAGSPIHYIIPAEYLSTEYETVWFIKETGGRKPANPEISDPVLQQVYEDLEHVEPGITWDEMEGILKGIEKKIIQENRLLITRKKIKGKPRKDGKNYEYTYDDGKVEISSKEGEAHLAKQLADRRLSQHRNALNKVYNPHYGNREPFRDNKSYRLFHPYVNLPKDYWEYLTIKGEKVREIDASNCQPLLIGQLIKKFSRESETIEELEENIAQHIIDLLVSLTIRHNQRKPKPKSKVNPYTRLWEHCNDSQGVEGSIRSVDIGESIPYLFYHLDSEDGLDYLKYLSRNKDLHEWVSSAIEGKLYEKATNKLYERTPESTDYKEFKSKVKVQTLKYMYSDPAYNNNAYDLKGFREGYNRTFNFLNAVKVRIGVLFTTLEDTNLLKSMILESKLKTKHTTPTKIGGVLLSIGIQAMESYIFIDNILPRLQEEGIVAIPKHDAVLVANSDYNRAKEVVEVVLEYFFGRNEYGEPNFHLNV